MTQNILRSNEIPIGLGPYSNAILVNDLLYVSGTLGFNRTNKEVVGNNAGKPFLKPQVDQIFNNINGISKVLQVDSVDLLKMNTYLSSWDQFTQLEEVLAKNCNNLPAISISGQGLLNNGFSF